MQMLGLNEMQEYYINSESSESLNEAFKNNKSMNTGIGIGFNLRLSNKLI